MAFSLTGYKTWEARRDEEGHRIYTLVSRVTTEDPDDGPERALATPGLPLPGAPWILGNDVDLWAWCRWDAEVRQVVKDEKNKFFDVVQTFSSKPISSDRQRIPSPTPGGGGGSGGSGGGGGGGGPHQQPDDPLLEPMKISGGFTKFTEEATLDKDGLEITNSAYEPFRGPQVEFDSSRPFVRIEQNVAFLGIEMMADFINCVNDSVLWGFPARCVKLSSASWEQKFHGQYQIYYTRVFEFEINCKWDQDLGEYVSGWDRRLQDEGTKVLQGRWDKETGNWVLTPVGYNGSQTNPILPDPNNPQDFMQAIDRSGNFCRILLNGAGLPANVNVQGTGTESATGAVGTIVVQKYEERNLLLLGIPA